MRNRPIRGLRVPSGGRCDANVGGEPLGQLSEESLQHPGSDSRVVRSTPHSGAGPAAAPQREAVERLREQLQRWEAGETPPLIDREREAELRPAIARARRLLDHRPRSVHELRERLRAADTEPDVIDEVVQRCIDGGLLNDAAFAREWVRQRQQNQRKAVGVLRRELASKGVAPGLIEDALSDVDPQDQREILASLVEKKAHTITAVPQGRAEYDRYLRRIVGVAARRGFPEGESLAAGRRALDERIAQLRAEG